MPLSALAAERIEVFGLAQVDGDQGGALAGEGEDFVLGIGRAADAMSRLFQQRREDADVGRRVVNDQNVSHRFPL